MPETETVPDTTETTTQESWRDSLPDDIKSSESLSKFEAVPDLAKSYLNLEKSMSNRVAIPGENATEEDVRAFYTKLGCPEKADGYEPPTELPEGVTLDETLTKAWFDEAHKMGLNRQQAARAIKFQADVVGKAAAAHRQASETSRAEAETALKQEWGNAYDEKIGHAQAAIASLEDKGATGLKKLVAEHDLGNHPALVKALAAIGKYMVQDEILGKGGTVSFELTPADASKKLAEKQRDESWMKALHDGNHPSHKEVAAEYQRLQMAIVAKPGDVPTEIRFDPVSV